MHISKISKIDKILASPLNLRNVAAITTNCEEVCTGLLTKLVNREVGPWLAIIGIQAMYLATTNITGNMKQKWSILSYYNFIILRKYMNELGMSCVWTCNFSSIFLVTQKSYILLVQLQLVHSVTNHHLTY